MIRNKRCYYLVEGECEEKLINALKEKPALIVSGKVKKYNVVQQELTTSQLMTFAPGSNVILVFDTDVELTDILKRNIALLRKQCGGVEVMTVTEVLNFEDEIERATNVAKAQDLTKSKSVSEFKTAVNKMKAAEFRHALNRHKFDLGKLWVKEPPVKFRFLSQDGEKIKTEK